MNCVFCAFTALQRTKSAQRSDLWLWYRFELHSKHNSTFSYYIVHFLCHSDCYFCLTLLFARTLFFLPCSMSATLRPFHSINRHCGVFLYLRFFLYFRSTFSVLRSFFIVISFRFHFIRLFAFFSHSFFCLQTAHKSFCECEPNERYEEEKRHTHTYRKRGRESDKAAAREWKKMLTDHLEEEECPVPSQNKFNNIIALHRLNIFCCWNLCWATQLEPLHTVHMYTQPLLYAIKPVIQYVFLENYTKI